MTFAHYYSISGNIIKYRNAIITKHENVVISLTGSIHYRSFRICGNEFNTMIEAFEYVDRKIMELNFSNKLKQLTNE